MYGNGNKTTPVSLTRDIIVKFRSVTIYILASNQSLITYIKHLLYFRHLEPKKQTQQDVCITSRHPLFKNSYLSGKSLGRSTSSVQSISYGEGGGGGSRLIHFPPPPLLWRFTQHLLLSFEQFHWTNCISVRIFHRFMQCPVCRSPLNLHGRRPSPNIADSC
jgi:hypothetical protein